MPEGWQTVPIGDVLVSAQYDLNLPVTPDGTVPIIGMKDMVAGRVENNGWGCVALAESSCAKHLLHHGDILLNRTNSPDLVGKVALWDRSEAAVFPSYIVRFRADEDRADAAFLKYVLNSDDGQTRLKALSTRGVSQANINPTTFRKAFTLALPPVAEQRRIAGLLDIWDDAIATAERLHACLIRANLGLQGKIFVAEEDTMLFEMAHVAFSGVDKRIMDGEQSVRLCNYVDVLRNRRLRDSIQFTAGTATQSERQRFSLRRDDVVFTKDSETAAEIAEASYVADDLENVVCGYHLAIARPKPGFSGAYLSHAMRVPRIRQQFVSRANGAIRFGLTLTAIQQVRLPAPTFERQLAISSALDHAEDEAQSYEAIANLLRRQQRGLMQKLLTGEWRMPVTGDAFAPGGPVVDRLEAAE